MALIERSLQGQIQHECHLYENNGNVSCTKHTKHTKYIKIRYFYIPDKVKLGEVTKYSCPIKEMIADFFTKPMAGAVLFKKSRNIIEDISQEDMPKYKRAYDKDSDTYPTIRLNKCVGNQQARPTYVHTDSMHVLLTIGKLHVEARIAASGQVQDIDPYTTSMIPKMKESSTPTKD